LIKNLDWDSKAEVKKRNSENKSNHVIGKSLVQKKTGVVREVWKFSELALIKREVKNALMKVLELRSLAKQTLSNVE